MISWKQTIVGVAPGKGKQYLEKLGNEGWDVVAAWRDEDGTMELIVRKERTIYDVDPVVPDLG